MFLLTPLFVAALFNVVYSLMVVVVGLALADATCTSACVVSVCSLASDADSQNLCPIPSQTWRTCSRIRTSATFGP